MKLKSTKEDNKIYISSNKEETKKSIQNVIIYTSVKTAVLCMRIARMRK